jgi:hypothetical protein
VGSDVVIGGSDVCEADGFMAGAALMDAECARPDRDGEGPSVNPESGRMGGVGGRNRRGRSLEGDGLCRCRSGPH